MKKLKLLNYLKKNDMKITAFIQYKVLHIKVDTYCTLQGFWGDEDYYQHHIRIDEENTNKMLEILKNTTSTDTILECIKEKFSCDSADTDIIEFCKQNNIDYDYYNRIDGSIDLKDKEKMDKKIKELKEERQRDRGANYKIH